MERLEGKVKSPPKPVGVGAQGKQILAKLCATWARQLGFPFIDLVFAPEHVQRFPEVVVRVSAFVVSR